MSLDEFKAFGYETSDEDFYDLTEYEEIDLDELSEGDVITGKPVATLFESEKEYQSDSMRFYILASDENGVPIKVKFYCQVPKPIGWSPDNYPLTNIFKNNKYERNTYNVIYSILKLQGFKNINDKDGNPVNSFKNVSVEAYLNILSEQDEISIKIKGTGNDAPYNNTIEITNIK